MVMDSAKNVRWIIPFKIFGLVIDKKPQALEIYIVIIIKSSWFNSPGKATTKLYWVKRIVSSYTLKIKHLLG